MKEQDETNYEMNITQINIALDAHIFLSRFYDMMPI